VSLLQLDPSASRRPGEDSNLEVYRTLAAQTGFARTHANPLRAGGSERNPLACRSWAPKMDSSRIHYWRATKHSWRWNGAMRVTQRSEAAPARINDGSLFIHELDHRADSCDPDTRTEFIETAVRSLSTTASGAAIKILLKRLRHIELTDASGR